MPRVASRQVAEVATSTESSPLLRQYLNEISKHPRVDAKEEKVLGRAIRKGDADALQKLVEANLLFVVYFARRYRGRGLSLLDLINEGNVGLIEAAKRFDPNQKVKFITYAVWWVRQAIVQALADNGGSFRLPQKRAQLVHRIANSVKVLQVELHRQPTAEEVAERMGLDVEEVTTLMIASRTNVSLSDLLDEDHDFHVGDHIEQQTVPSAEDVLTHRMLRDQVRSALTELDTKEREVILLRFGIYGDERRTLREIGDRMGLSRERIRQIEAEALRKLRESARWRQLRSCLN